MESSVLWLDKGHTLINYARHFCSGVDDVIALWRWLALRCLKSDGYWWRNKQIETANRLKKKKFLPEKSPLEKKQQQQHWVMSAKEKTHRQRLHLRNSKMKTKMGVRKAFLSVKRSPEICLSRKIKTKNSSLQFSSYKIKESTRSDPLDPLSPHHKTPKSRETQGILQH